MRTSVRTAGGRMISVALTLGLVGAGVIASVSPARADTPRVGTVWAWGANQEGQLGDGTRIDRHSPI